MSGSVFKKLDSFEQSCASRTAGRMFRDNSNSQLSIEVHHSLDLVEDEWRFLEDEINCSPFQRLSWIKPIYQPIAANHSIETNHQTQPFIVAGRVNQKLVFVLPMVLERSFLGNYVKWAGAKCSDYNGMVMHPGYPEVIGSGVFRRVINQIKHDFPDLDAIHLSKNPVNSMPAEWVGGDEFSSWQTEYSSHALNLSKSWTALYQQIRSTKSRHRLRSKARAFKRSGSISFRQVRSSQERLQAVRQILQWKTNHLAKLGSMNPFGSESHPSETRAVIEASVRDNDPHSIKVFGLYRDGQLVAGMLAFIDEANFYYLVSAYSPNIPSKFSIGTQLLVKTLEFACRTGKKNYDFLIGDEAYKFDWCDTTIPLHDHIAPFTLKGRLLAAGIRASLHAKSVVKQSPSLSRIAKNIIRAGGPQSASDTDRALKLNLQEALGSETKADVSKSEIKTRKAA